ncbi:NKG2-A/NKG2-B type II integral membrane protein-like [Caretta caretta]|uniref:NKG2-A/NKG2-B type II integral membrane protein-like n=1 Tax=Caretta caretta TaxID=8467 RepID=UPI003F4C485F
MRRTLLMRKRKKRRRMRAETSSVGASSTLGQRLSQIRRQKKKTREDMFNKLMRASKSDKTELSARRIALSDSLHKDSEDRRACREHVRDTQDKMVWIMREQIDMLRRLAQVQERQLDARVPLHPMLNLLPSSPILHPPPQNVLRGRGRGILFQDSCSLIRKHLHSPPEMSEQEITYTELKFHTPTQQQMWQRAEKTKTKDFASPSSPWRYVAVILGILCVVLLGAVGFQSVKRDNCSLCPENWIQHEENCYHFSTEWKTWQESQDYCSSRGSRLLKIHSKKKQDFIKPLAFSYHWIGLFRNGINESWVWEDGTALTLNLFAEHPDFNSGDCAAFRIGEAHSYVCTQSKPYICEQRAT